MTKKFATVALVATLGLAPGMAAAGGFGSGNNSNSNVPITTEVPGSSAQQLRDKGVANDVPPGITGSIGKALDRFFTLIGF